MMDWPGLKTDQDWIDYHDRALQWVLDLRRQRLREHERRRAESAPLEPVPFTGDDYAAG